MNSSFVNWNFFQTHQSRSLTVLSWISGYLSKAPPTTSCSCYNVTFQFLSIDSSIYIPILRKEKPINLARSLTVLSRISEYLSKAPPTITYSCCNVIFQFLSIDSSIYITILHKQKPIHLVR